MLVIKAATLCDLVAFFGTHAMLLNDKADVVDNVLLGDGLRQYIVIMGKQKPHFLGVVTDRTLGIALGYHRVVHLMQAGLCYCGEGYFAVLIFFS